MAVSPEPEQLTDADRMLLDFVRDRDVACPSCGYNVRNLTKPVCPECEEPLVLKVGGKTYPVRWLLATVAPGIFTGVTAGVMAVTLLIMGPPNFVSLGVIFTGIFFIASAALAVVLIIWNKRFIRQPQPRQIMWAVLLWVIHLSAFFTFLAYMLVP